MLRLALVGDHDASLSYATIQPRLEGMAFTAVVGSQPLPADVARRFGQILSPASVDELLSDHSDGFDAMVIHAAVDERRDLILRAAAAGKHVFVQSPLSATASEATKAVASCQEHGVCLMVGNLRRFTPSAREIHGSLAAGNLGRLGLLRIHQWSHGGNGTRSLAAVVGEADVACWMFGAAPDIVFAARPAETARGAGDQQLHLGFPGGGMALIDCCQSLPSGSPPYSMLTAVGSLGAAYADDHHNTQLLFQADGLHGLPSQGDGESVWLALSEFADAIAGDRPPMSNGTDGCRALAVVEAAAASQATGRPATCRGEPHDD